MTLEALLGTEYGAFTQSLSQPPRHGLRINRLKGTPDSVIPCLDFDTAGLRPVPWCMEGYDYPACLRPAKSLAYHAGLFYIQEPSAMAPAAVLNARPGERVLDICAAPGGKTVQLAGQMGHGGLLVANDASASRSRALIRNLEMAGVKNAVVLNEQPNRLAEYFPAFFDRVLVDAPCSGEGMFRRDKDAAKTSAANKPAACAKTQREILRHSAAMLKPGGRLVYSTCTFNKQENEDIIEAFLLNHKEFSVLSVDHSSLGVSTGFDPLRETARIWPHRSPGEGHFIALLEKRDNEKDGVQIPSPSKKTTSPAVKFVPRTARTAYESFCEAAFRNKPRGLYQLHKKALCRVPEGIPDLSGLRIARGGWYLGDVSKERFTPSQAMAMAMSVKEARHGLNLSKSDALLYIKGHSFIPENNYTPESGKPWILVGYKGFPLGWARWKDGRLINRLPGSWVMR